jgi:hypothetical protein
MPVEPEAGFKEPGGSGLGGVKGMLGKKVAGIPVWILVAAVAAAGLWLAMRNKASQAADASSVDTGAGAQDYSGSGVVDPGGVSGLGGGQGFGGGGGFDPTNPGVGAGIDASGLASSIAEGVAAGIAQSSPSDQSGGGVEFPSGSPVTQAPAGPRHSTAIQSKKAAPAKSRGGQAVATKAKAHPVVAARGKPKPTASTSHAPAKKPATHKPVVATHTPSPRSPARPAGRKPAPKSGTGKVHR